MTDFSEVLSNPGFYILFGVGEGAIIMMLIILKTMNQSSIMPTWVKFVSIFVIVPVVAFITTMITGE
jgi:hypothetical protein